jgi:hypothetical protein
MQIQQRTSEVIHSIFDGLINPDFSYIGLQSDEVQSVSLDPRLLREVGDLCTSLN